MTWQNPKAIIYPLDNTQIKELVDGVFNYRDFSGY